MKLAEAILKLLDAQTDVTDLKKQIASERIPDYEILVPAIQDRTRAAEELEQQILLVVQSASWTPPPPPHSGFVCCTPRGAVDVPGPCCGGDL
jgi:hypothetical protein